MKNKTVFISGASSGIGRETAFKFASEGAMLALTYHNNRIKGQKTLERCLEMGAESALLVNLDVTDTGSITAAVRQIRKKYKFIDILINNAGIGVVKPFARSSMKEIEGQLRTNLEGLIKVTYAFLPYTKEKIINIGSFLSKHAFPDMAVYCASKFGVRGFTQSLAQEQKDLKICTVNPDLTATPLTGNQGRPPSTVADVIYKVAAGRIRVRKGGDVDVWDIVK